MAYCPNCRAEMSDDFGLQTCSSCKAQVFAVSDGAPPEVPVQQASFITNAPIEQEARDVKTNLTQIVDELSQVLAGDLAGLELPNVVPERTKSRSVEMKPATPDMSDVAAFANSEASQGREGLLRFNVYISGIDTADVRSEIKEILSDAKFRYDFETAISEIKNGELQIKNFSAIKTSLLVQRLRYLPVEVRWEQYAIHQ